MTQPATHYGHCQLCGREQKLPGGRLSKHGYTVRWSFFEGVCPGADHLPYEQACNLLDRALELARVSAAQLRTQAVSVTQVSDRFWVNEYFRAEGRTPSYHRWAEYPLSALTEDNYSYTPSDGGKLKGLALYVGTDRATVVAACNRRRADALNKEAAEYDSYASWLAERIDAWLPDQPLRPIEPEAVLPEVAFKVVYIPNAYGHKYKVTEGPDAFIGRRFVSERAAARAIAKSTGGSI